MTFVHVGLAIAGAAAIAIPILVHLLFRHRRRPINWGAMRFLMEAYRRSRRRTRLEQWILLAMRCLIIGLIGAAIARPLFQDTDWRLLQGGRIVYLLIDNGIAASVETAEGVTAFDRHRETARTIVSELGPSDRIGLITLARPHASSIDPPVVDHSAVGRLIGELRPTDAPTDIEAALERLRESIDSQSDDRSPLIVYLLSDFFTGSADLSRPLPSVFHDLERAIALVASPPSAESIEQTQVIATRPVRSVLLPGAGDGSGQFSVHLRRVGDVGSAGVSTIRVESDLGVAGQPIAVRWEPGQSEATADARLALGDAAPGPFTVRTTIDNDALSADNSRVEILEIREAIRVGVMDRREFRRSGDLQEYSAGAWLRAALDPGQASPLEISEIDPVAIDPAALRRVDAVVLPRPDLVSASGWEAIGEYVNGGGMLWLMPAAGQQVAFWTDEAKQALDLPWTWARETVNYVEGDPNGLLLAAEQPESDLLRMIQPELNDLAQPVAVYRTLPIVEGLDPAGEALRLENGEALLATASPAQSEGLVVYLSTAPQLDWTSLPAKPLMVAMTHETIRQGLGLATEGRELIAGDDRALALPTSAAALVGANGESIPLAVSFGAVRPTAPLVNADAYRVVDSADQTIGRIAVNVDPDAARTDAQVENAILEWLVASGDWMFFDEAAPAEQLRQESEQAEVSMMLLLIVLLLAALETILARWFSHAKREDLATGLAAAGSSSPSASTATSSSSPGASAVNGKGATA